MVSCGAVLVLVRLFERAGAMGLAQPGEISGDGGANPTSDFESN